MVPKKRVTIKDVAKFANLSISTVSGVLNNVDEFSAETKKRVWDAALSLNYRPNKEARQLRAGGVAPRVKTRLLMRINHLGGRREHYDEFDARRAYLFDSLANERGYFTTNYAYCQLEGFRCPLIISDMIEGVVVGSPHGEVIDFLRSKVPVVLLDVASTSENEDIPAVNMNMEAGFQVALAEMKSLGHQNFAMVYSKTREDYRMNDNLQNEAIRRAMHIHNLTLLPEADYLLECTPATNEIEVGRIVQKLIPQIKSGRISAIVTPNISHAQTMYEMLLEQGIRVPEDVSMLSGSHLIGAQPHNISAVTYDWEKMIQIALDVLHARIEGRELHCLEYLVRPGFDRGATIRNINLKLRMEKEGAHVG